MSKRETTQIGRMFLDDSENEKKGSRSPPSDEGQKPREPPGTLASATAALKDDGYLVPALAGIALKAGSGVVGQSPPLVKPWALSNS
jgi:hypothetical protein